MRPTPLQQIADFAQGKLIQGDPALEIERVSTDTRSLHGGELWVALAGEHFDAHDFAQQAIAKGAAALLLHRLPEEPNEWPCAMILVEDTLVALQKLAAAYRAQHDPLVVGVTGSNGKTTTKDFLTSVLSQKWKVCATAGNLNNHIGLPLSILSLESSDDCAVWEMGMNHPGEIAPLAAIARPDVAVVTNIGTAHIEFMKTRLAIAEEKSELAKAVAETGTVVLNANDEYTDFIAERTAGRVIRAGIKHGQVQAQDLCYLADGMSFVLLIDGQAHPATIPVPGEHMVGNAVLAAATGHALGLSPAQIVAGLASVELNKGRLRSMKARGMTILDDTYNANPDSMRAGLHTLMALPGAGRKIAVLGKMAERGEHADQEHLELGQHAALLGISALFSVGEAARGIADGAETVRAEKNLPATVRHFDSRQECADYLRDFAAAGDQILVKGSRSAKMEDIITQLTA